MVNEDTSQNHKNDCIVIDIENDTKKRIAERHEELVSKPKIHDPVGLKPRVISVYYYQEGNVGSQPTYNRENVEISSAEYDDYSYDDGFFIEDFSDTYSRNRFIQKVYFILVLQLVFTIAFICASIFIDKIRDFVSKNLIAAISTCVLFFVLLIMVLCCRCARKTFPINLILLLGLTACYSYMVAYVSIKFDTKIVVMSILIAAAICLAVSVFACQTRFDITRCLVACILIVILGLVLALIIVVLSKFIKFEILDLSISLALGLLACMYLIYDTQMIMGGRRMELASDEYILGALCLYVDMMSILLIIMYLLKRT